MNPFSAKSKKMIKDMGNVELFELCETLPETQGKECILCWNQGIVYCTCGHLLRVNQSSRGVLRWTLDLLPILSYVIKKGDLMAIVMGRLKYKKTTTSAHNLRKEMQKREDLKGFTIASKKILYFVSVNSALMELK